MKNNVELLAINEILHERQNEACERHAILAQLKGFKYWLFFFGL